MDRARKKTDKILADMERRIQAVYLSDPSLKKIQKRYDRYMKRVQKLTEASYLAFQNEKDINHRSELKNVYMDELEALTVKNKQYRDIVSEFTRIMAGVNQQALDIVNAEMPEIYMLNYNQLAVTCRKIGIRVEE